MNLKPERIKTSQQPLLRAVTKCFFDHFWPSDSHLHRSIVQALSYWKSHIVLCWIWRNTSSTAVAAGDATKNNPGSSINESSLGFLGAQATTLHPRFESLRSPPLTARTLMNVSELLLLRGQKYPKILTSHTATLHISHHITTLTFDVVWLRNLDQNKVRKSDNQTHELQPEEQF